MGKKEPTLIVFRRTLVESKAALAGAMLETFFARLRASMAAFSEKRAPSSDRWDLVAIVETQGSREETVRRAAREQESEP